MAESGNIDELCREFFQLNVEKEQAKKLPLAEKKQGKGTTVRKILKDGLGETSAVVQFCEASVMSKHQNKTTKKISDDDFVGKVLPDIAVHKAKAKSIDDPKAQEELTKMKSKLCKKLEEMKSDTGKGKNAAVVDRLTDSTKYTGAHKERFDASGKGKGKDGREDIVDNSGYVGNYKGEGTYDKKK